MKILLSAYACEPHKGSEPAVGWNWLLALIDQGHDVWVITRRNNRASLEAEIAKRCLAVHPVYYDPPRWCARWKRWPGGLYLYYLLWQFGAYREAQNLHRVTQFDVVHHITFVTFRQPSFMGNLGIPFLLGPVGGGETSPRPLRTGMNFAGRIQENIRDLLIALAARDPLMRRTFSKATLIACTTAETLHKIPARYHGKCMVLPAIGIDPPLSQTPPSAPSTPTFLFVGRLLYWKGLHLVLRAMPQVLRQVPNARLRIVGRGKDARWLKHVAETAGVSASVDWVAELPHNEIAAAYQGQTAFVFPSLHDSGGMVVLESLAAQLPVICLDLGGPGVFVNPSCGIVIETKSQSEASIQNSITAAMISLVQQPSRRAALASGGDARARQFTWASAAQQLYTALAQKTSAR